ncbi:ABC transporter substrate-binding protein [Cryptosporangium sp. NPDC048952]|uniref:ABC transporter substrate-binding protein n=1 Tax=Cryptosporangium sp. NPDC048952 TaxID=3363961 RepID=UPI0037141A28
MRRLALASVLLLTAACGSSATQTTAATGAYPVTVENCGATVTFDAEPERVVMLKSAAVPYLHDLGVMDRITAKAGQYPQAYYDAQTQAELDTIPLLTDKTDTSGHLQISQEIVIAQKPDLVLGQVDNLSRETLSAVDIPLIEEPALCETTQTKPTFDSVYEQMDLYGKVFDEPSEASAANADLKKRVQAATASTPSGRTAAVLYPTVGGGTTYAYGTLSMADPQLKAAGFTNVFGNVDERVFEVTREELLGRNPDVLILLYSDGDPQTVDQAITSLPGANQLNAVKNGNVLTQLFNFTEPPTPLSVTGLEMIRKRFG